MKVQTDAKLLEMEGFENEGKKFSIEQNSRAFEILSSNIYSDKILAVVREYGCNAMDAHIAAGKADVPFEVHLPNNFEPWFSIKDFGIGLSKDSVMGLFSTYFKSTKADSNTMVGALGLGSKSGFAYSDQFTVTSNFDGVKTQYSCFVNEEGSPCVTPLGDGVPTTESNGVEIYMAVKPKDFGTFADRAKKVFHRFPVLPIIGGAKVDLTKVVYGLTGTNYKLRTSSDNNWNDHKGCYAVQGAVAYPIDVEAFGDDLPEEVKDLFKYIPLDITFPIGDLNITASRERLNYDRRTQANLIATGAKIAEDLPKQFEHVIADAKSLFEAKVKYHDWMHNGEYDYHTQQMIRGKLKWKGLEVHDGDFKVKLYDLVPAVDEKGSPIMLKTHDGSVKQMQKEEFYGSGVSFNACELRRDRPKSNTYDPFGVTADKGAVIIRKDMTIRSVGALLKHNFEGKNKDCYVFDVPDARWQEVLDQLGNPPDSVVMKMSELEEIPEEPTTVGADGIVRAVRKLMFFNRLSSSPDFGVEECTADMNVPGIFVALYDKRMLRPGKEKDTNETSSGLPEVLYLGYILGFFNDATGKPQRIHAVNSQFKGPLLRNKVWSTAWDHMRPKLQALIDDKPLMDAVKFMAQFHSLTIRDNIADLFDDITRAPGSFKLLTTKDSELEEYYNLAIKTAGLVTKYLGLSGTNLKIAHEKSSQLLRLLTQSHEYLGLKNLNLDENPEVDKFFNELFTIYPLLANMAYRRGSSLGDYTIKQTLHYIDLCDHDPSLVTKHKLR